MTRRLLVVFCCVMLIAATTFAQARSGKSAKADPISGTWTGTLTPQNAPGPMSVTMELKFDGKSAVTGTASGLPNPADVKAGSSFDPKSGALKMQLGKTSDSAVLLVLEGTVVKGTASGKVNGDGGAGEFKITKKP
jgi:hypothetical protein